MCMKILKIFKDNTAMKKSSPKGSSSSNQDKNLTCITMVATLKRKG